VHLFASDQTGVPWDTAIVVRGQTVPVVFDADTPVDGCCIANNIYHPESGTMTQLGYQR
jgi:hypothetical protein